MYIIATNGKDLIVIAFTFPNQRSQIWAFNMSPERSKKPVMYNFDEVSPNETITHLACGRDYIIIVTSLNRILVRGDNSNGQLSLELERTWLDTFTPVPGIPFAPDERITHFVQQSGSIIIVTSLNRILVKGNNSNGQLSLELERTWLNTFTPVPGIPFKPDERITHVTCGWRGTVIATSLNGLLVTGCNRWSRLGLGYEKASVNTFTPVPEIPFEPDERITHVTCNLYSTIIATSQGRILATNTMDKEKKPPYFKQRHQVKLAAGETIAHLQSNTSCVMMITSAKQWWIWNANTNEMTDSGLDLEKFKLILQSNETIVNLDCGISYTVIVTSLGRVLVTGRIAGQPFKGLTILTHLPQAPIDPRFHGYFNKPHVKHDDGHLTTDLMKEHSLYSQFFSICTQAITNPIASIDRDSLDPLLKSVLMTLDQAKIPKGKIWLYAQLIFFIKIQHCSNQIAMFPRYKARTQKMQAELYLKPDCYLHDSSYYFPLLNQGSPSCLLSVKPWIVLCAPIKPGKTTFDDPPNFSSDLVDDMLNYVCQFLSRTELLKLARVNKKLNHFIYSQSEMRIRPITIATPLDIADTRFTNINSIEHVRLLIQIIVDLSKDERAYALLHLIMIGKFSLLVLIDIYTDLIKQKESAENLLATPILPIHMLTFR